MKFGKLVLAAALAFGLGGAASATPLAPSPAELIQQPDTLVEYAKRKGWKGHRGRHYGWYRGRHRGWYKHHRRAYYAYPRRHYGWRHRRAYYAYPRRHYRSYYRPAYYAYPRRHYGYGYYPRSRGVYIRF
jgi:hypothetical protein